MRTLAPVLAALMLSTALPAQQGETTFSSGASEVVVDVVVRNKGGKAARNLSASDFSVSENGVTQTLTSVRFTGAVETAVEGAENAPAEVTVQKSAATGSVKIDRPIRLVSLVFARVSVENRRQAREAALEFLKTDVGPNAYYAVFFSDRIFSVLQSYTNDLKLLRKAVEQAATIQQFVPDGRTGGLSSSLPTGGTTRPFSAETVFTQDLNIGAVPVTAAGPGTEANVLGSAASLVQAERIEAFNRDFTFRQENQLLAETGVFNLWGIINELGRLPGRKSILYFSEGLQLSANVRSTYRAMLAAANRAQVAIYPFDVRGLHVQDDFAQGRYAIAQAVQPQLTGDPLTDNVAEAGQFRFAEWNATDVTSSHKQMNLLDLAESTGGFLTANTNDFRPAMRRLSEDFNSYYLLTYRPSNPALDGSYRKIQVKLNRPGLTLQARDGYFALPSVRGDAVFPFEFPLLKTLSQSALPKDLDFRAAALPYQHPDGDRYALLMDMPLSQIQLRADPKTNQQVAHVAVMALIKNEAGEVVAKISKDLPVQLPADKANAFHNGRLSLTRVIALEPGRYTVESAAADFASNKAAAKRAVLIVPERRNELLSDLVLVRRTEKAPPTVEPGNPFVFAGTMVIPTLQPAISRQEYNSLAFYARLYPKAIRAQGQLIVELWDGNRLIQGKKADLEADGSPLMLAHLDSFPLQTVPPGHYELRATFRQGPRVQTKSLFVQID